MSSRQRDETSVIYRIPPYNYLHVLDQNSNVTTTVIGPKTFIRQENERVVVGPSQMITVPPNQCCIIENPVVRNARREIELDAHGQPKVAFGDVEVRLAQEPFPLYPGEVVKLPPTPLQLLPANHGFLLRAVQNFNDSKGVTRAAGDEYLFAGPGTYIPRKEEVIIVKVKPSLIKSNQALRLCARKDCVDRYGNARKTGEEWLVKEVGEYLPGENEVVVGTVDGIIITEKNAVHLRALRGFVDDYGVERRTGEEWLITSDETDVHIPSVNEELVGITNITTLTSRRYCVILDPVGDDGQPQLGKKKLVQGEVSFFLRPGEQLERGIEDVFILGENDGLILQSIESFAEKDGITRRPGDRWMIRGPCEYVPPVQVQMVTERKAIPLDENEGIYVRDVKTGKVRAICGETYMLTHDEELWDKELPPAVENLLVDQRDHSETMFVPMQVMNMMSSQRNTNIDAHQASNRNKTKMVTFRVHHNAAVQVYDYKEKKARVVFGPDLVMLGPDEQFTQLSLSGGKPKRPNVIRSLCLLLGPDFCTDILTVETADHARLSLQLAYNWHFEVKNRSDPEEAAKLFSVPDFVGDACKAIASRVRGAVAAVSFDEFHKSSARVIRASVFGYTEQMKIRDRFFFPQNNLVVTSVDIQSVEPVDQRTRDALQKSVQLAIEITTNSQEATARHEAQRLEQEAKGRLERQKIVDEAEAEKARRELLDLQALSAAVESTGQAKAEAQSRAEASKIEGEAAVEQAKLKAQADEIAAQSELERLTRAREAELKYLRESNIIEVENVRSLADVEVNKFSSMVESIGASTIQAIATAGPEMQVKLLQSLGLQSTLITDGKNPINLFNTAQGMVALSGPPSAKRARLEEAE